MTEAEWRACNKPEPMLKFLRGKASDRKLRLFAVACCRRLWPHIADERSRRAVEMSERLADGPVAPEDLSAAAYAATAAVYDKAAGSHAPAFAVADRTTVTEFDAVNYAVATAEAAVHEAMRLEAWRSRAVRNVEERRQTLLLRDLFGNLFRPVPIHSAWLARKDATVNKLAQAIYDERAFDRLPQLADALEKAGCDGAAILDHCRRPGEHVRGCWVVDALLGKE